ncbi:MAG TPA: hypothetical protein VFI25_11305 [Planctomycetota bacterium]|jgi:hypothetical protein|nr:hypothetical protein [Planctomycetota bacterium]
MVEDKSNSGRGHGDRLTKDELTRMADFLSQQLAPAIAGAVDGLFAARRVSGLASKMGHGDAERVWSRLGTRMRKLMLALMWDTPKRATGDSGGAPLEEEVGAER